MKIHYRREWKRNYLIIEPEELNWRNYECSMLEENVIDGVLRFQFRQVDEAVRFYYEITSKQPLARMLENHRINSEEIRKLVFGISVILDRIEPYLLREGSIFMKPEYIYVEPDSFRIWLCLVPGLDRDFSADYGNLLEYILGKVDHQDKESVVLAYGLYQETRKENYGMEDILRFLGTCSGVGEISIAVEEEKQAELTKGNSGCQEQEEVCRCEAGDENVSEESPSIWKRFWQWIKGIRGAKTEETIQVPLEWLFGEEEDLSKQDVISMGHDTVLLAAPTQEKKTEGPWLRALYQGGEDILISYYPFVIGKQENLVDYQLLHDTVSRIHVKIDRDGEGWVIEDLNSTNGTIVGGRPLENNETTVLCSGDQVQIAGFLYRFE